MSPEALDTENPAGVLSISSSLSVNNSSIL